MNFYPVFLREMIIFRRRLLRFGYLLSTMITPLLYLVAFGLGLGRGISVDGVPYLAFVIPGICAMSSMTNSYTWIATSVAVGRLHFKTYEAYQISPLTATDIMTGQILSGMVRGLFASSLVIVAGALFGAGFPKSPAFYLAWILNCLIFACLGVVSGFRARSHEDTAIFSNFLIMPMAFFCGTFFPIEKLPGFIQACLYFLPLTHATKALRNGFMGNGVATESLLIMLVVLILSFYWGVYSIKKGEAV